MSRHCSNLQKNIFDYIGVPIVTAHSGNNFDLERVLAIVDQISGGQ